MRIFSIIILLISFLPVITHGAIGPVGRSTSLNFDGSIQSGTLPQYYENFINRDGSTVAIGTLMCLSLTEDDGASIISCPAAAGGIPVCVMAVSCEDDKACKCQYWGLNDSVLFDHTNSAATAGQAAYVSENVAGKIQATAFGSVVATDVPVGVFYDSPSTTSAVEIFLKL